jgi:hypothetical protein
MGRVVVIAASRSHAKRGLESSLPQQWDEVEHWSRIIKDKQNVLMVLHIIIFAVKEISEVKKESAVAWIFRVAHNLTREKKKVLGKMDQTLPFSRWATGKRKNVISNSGSSDNLDATGEDDGGMRTTCHGSLIPRRVEKRNGLRDTA